MEKFVIGQEVRIVDREVATRYCLPTHLLGEKFVVEKFAEGHLNTNDDTAKPTIQGLEWYVPASACELVTSSEGGSKQTAFQRVAEMNAAFGNPKGNPEAIDVERIRSQCMNMGHEFVELLEALGASAKTAKAVRAAMDKVVFDGKPDVTAVRDALCDSQVFGNGAHHLMGYDADRDMDDVIDGVFTRFIKDEADKEATIALHAKKGVTDVYFEGEYPKMVMKSASDQPDAPKGKFLKSASYSNTVFRAAP